jgi:DNA-binding ferritin-like protein
MKIDIKGFLNAYAGSAKAEDINPMAVDAPVTEEMGVDSIETSGNGGFISGLLEANVKLRMLHWNTTSFSAHSALGKAYESLNEQIDDFIETYIGARGRGLLSTVSSLNVSASEDPSAVLDSLESLLRNDIQNDLGETETALLNMRDEMLGLVQKTKYLLTLE